MNEAQNQADQATAEAPKPQQKWTSEAGPLQSKRVNEALNNIRSEHAAHTEKWGVIGVDERSMSFVTLGGGRSRPEVTEAWNKLGEQFAWKVTRDNYKDIIDAAAAALPALIASRPVDDKRKTPEQDAAEKAERANAEANRERLEAEKLAPFLAAYGQPGEKVSVGNNMAVCAVLTFNNSDIRSDYFDDHASLGCKLLLGSCVKQAQTQSLARHFASLYPELAGISFEWHTEKYSGGHGNYLRQTDFVVIPREVTAGRTAYGSGVEISQGKWEIQFLGWEKVYHCFKGYPGTFTHHNGASGPTPTEVAGTTGTNGVAVRRNTEHDGVEVSFPTKPDAGTISELKSAGFRWSRFSKVWYKKYGAYAWAQAHRIAGLPLSGEHDPGEKAQPDPQVAQFVDELAREQQVEAAELAI